MRWGASILDLAAKSLGLFEMKGCPRTEMAGIVCWVELGSIPDVVAERASRLAASSMVKDMRVST